MYRETIEHPWSIPEPLKSHIDLNSGNDRGRIYRVTPEGFKQPTLPRLGSASAAELVQTLQHENGWHRDTAARLLYERQDRTVIPSLRTTLASATKGAVHALYALASLGALDEAAALQGLAHSRPEVQRHAVLLVPRIAGTDHQVSEPIWKALGQAAQNPDATVRYQVALSLGELNGSGRGNILASMAAASQHARANLGDRWIRVAILNSLLDDATDFAKRIFASWNSIAGSTGLSTDALQAYQDFLREMISCLAARRHETELAALLDFLETQRTEAGPTELAFELAAGLIERLRSRGGPDSTSPFGQRVQKFCRQAARHANDLARPKSERIAAVGLLSGLPWPEARPFLKPLLVEEQNDAVRYAAFSALARFDEEEASILLASLWTQATPRIRAEYVASALGRTPKTTYLLNAIEAGQIQRADLSSTQVDQLRNHRDRTIRDRARDLFPPSAHSRAEAVAAFETALDLNGDAGRGRVLFIERCASCHRLNSEGQAVGPDLASAKSSGKPKLLTSIIDPNREVPPNFFNYIIETKSGESFSGIIAVESDASVTLRRAFADENVIPRADIQRIQSSTLSLMPEGLEAGLSPQQMADLMEFIVAPQER
jgi:putative heme-binding domain-containing protein